MKNEKLFMILAYPIIIAVGLVAVLFVATPIVLYAFPHVHKLFIVNSFRIAPTSKAPFFGEELHGRRFFISAGASTVAVWHYVPAKEKDNPEAALKNGDYKILLYFHGKRSSEPSRFNTFAKSMFEARPNDVQIVAFNYKGFGNSAGECTKSGAVRDTRTVYDYLRRHAPDSEIHFWAHGLGGGIAAAALKLIVGDGQEVQSIVLEAPYTDTLAMLKASFFVVEMYSHILWPSFFHQSLNITDIDFDTVADITNVDVPALLLNSEHDKFAPPAHAAKILRHSRKKRDFVFHIQFRCTKFGHYPSEKASPSELKNIVSGFQVATEIFWNGTYDKNQH